MMIILTMIMFVEIDKVKNVSVMMIWSVKYIQVKMIYNLKLGLWCSLCLVVLLLVQIASKLLAIDYNNNDTNHNIIIVLVVVTNNVQFSVTLLMLTTVHNDDCKFVNYNNARSYYLRQKRSTLVSSIASIVHYHNNVKEMQCAIFTHSAK